MLKKQYEILYEIIKAPWKKFTFKDIKRLSGKTSESYTFNSLKELVKRGILSQERAGNVMLYSFNLKSVKAQCYAGFVSEYVAWKKYHIPHDVIEAIAAKIPTNFYSLIITGSYAISKQKESSDMDMVIICDDCLEPKKIYAELKQDCELSIPPIHLYVFKKSEFLLMLKDRKANYGKEITKNYLLFAGGKEYYSIIQEAKENGFNG